VSAAQLALCRESRHSLSCSAIVTQLGLGANLPGDAIYPVNLSAASGKPLHGSNRYSAHFDKGETPPADAFWSVTLYDAEGFQVANSLNRFNLASWMSLKYNADGSLDLYFQNESPGADKEANLLPAPKGAFNLLMRLYAQRLERRSLASGTRRAWRHCRASALNSTGHHQKGECLFPGHLERDAI